MAHQFKGDVATVSGGVISVSTPVKEAVVIYPEHKTLPITQNGCEWLIQLPDFTIQQFIILKKIRPTKKPASCKDAGFLRFIYFSLLYISPIT